MTERLDVREQDEEGESDMVVVRGEGARFAICDALMMRLSNDAICRALWRGDDAGRAETEQMVGFREWMKVRCMLCHAR